MACCSLTGMPFLVTPLQRVTLQDTEVGSFADLVDRTFAEVRHVLVTEHLQRLHINGSVPADAVGKFSWDLLPESQPLTLGHSASSTCAGKIDVVDAGTQTAETDAMGKSSRDILPESQSATLRQIASRASEKVEILDCATQTQVDWSWPMMPFSWSHIHEHSKHAVGVHPHGNHSVDVHPDESAVETCHDALERKSHRTSVKHATVTGFDMNSDDLQHLNEEKAQRLAEALPTSAWDRMMQRGKNAPLDALDAVMGVVIMANAVAIGVSSDTKSWEEGWLIVDSIFASSFLLELFFKVWVLGFRGHYCSPDTHWAWFETALVVLSIVEIALQFMVTDSSTATFHGSSLFRVIRLLRLVKILRIFRTPMASDLVMMVTGLTGGTRTLISALFLVLLPLFVFALVMRETLGEEPFEGTGARNFDTLPKACFNTFRCLVVEDCADEMGRPIFLLVADTYGWAYSVMYSLSLVLLKFGLYNVIIGIFVEQTVQAAKYNATYQKRKRLNDQIMFQEKSLELAELAYSLHKGMDRTKVACHLTIEDIQSLELSNEDFTNLCDQPEFNELLTSLDVAEEDHLDLFDTLDVDGGGTLDVGEIITGIAKLRGDARKSDIVAVILLSKHVNRSLTEFKDHTADVLEKQKQQLSSIQNAMDLILRTKA